MLNFRFAMAPAISCFLASCGSHCDVSEASPAVRLARSLRVEQLELLYADGLSLIVESPRTRIDDVEKMPDSFAALKPRYMMIGGVQATAKLAGCMDAAVFLSVERGRGVELSWGEDCLECRESLLQPQPAEATTDALN